MSEAPSLALVLGHHKCATGWISSVFREAAYRLGWRFRVVHRPSDWEALGHSTLADYVRAERPRILAYTNADAAHLDGLPAWRGLHTVRDPRDVWVSAYFSHLHSHPTDGWPELAAHRERLQALPKEEGLRAELAFSAPVFGQMAAWPYGAPHVMEAQMEALSADPAGRFTEAFQSLGLLAPEPAGSLVRAATRAALRLNPLRHRGRHRMPGRLPLSPVRIPLPGLPPAEVGAIVGRKSFARLSGGRRPGEEDVRSHYRKGQPGDWANHLTPDLLAEFEARHGGLVERLGYATPVDAAC